MIFLSLALLLGAMAGGAVLLARYRRGWALRVAHGGASGLGLLLLILALSGGQLRGKLAIDATGLLATGFAIGLFLAWLAWRRRRPPGLAVFLHATLAGLGALLVAGLALG